MRSRSTTMRCKPCSMPRRRYLAACAVTSLEAMAAELTAHPVASPAELRKVIIEVQQRYWTPPQLHEPGMHSKYR
jgi:hypothetical protein